MTGMHLLALVPRPTAPGVGRLPDGFVVRLASTTKVCEGGTALLGTSTGRYLRLRPPARARLVDGRVRVSDAASAALARLLLDRDLADPDLADPDFGGGATPGAADAADASVADVTVVIPVRDRPGQLARVLAALPRGVPVVVGDDGSAADAATETAEVADRHDALLLRLDPGRGPAAARNAGIDAATTAYVAFVDSDVVPEPGWLSRLAAHFEDPLVALVAPRVLGLEATEEDRGWLHRYEAVRSSLDLGPRPSGVHPHGQVAYLPSAAMMVRRSAWPGFDEDLQVGEDVDLVWRLHDAGWRLRYEPVAVVRHEHRTDVSNWLRRKVFYGTSADLLAARHGDAVAPLVVTPWTAAFAVCLLAQRRWSVPAAAGVYATATWRLSRRLGASRRPVATSASMTAVGAVAAVWQSSAALTRHYWPLAVTAAVVSRRARRALAVAAVADGLLDHHRSGTDLDPVRYVVARRLDDLGYGAGVWLGAWRGRSWRALRPAIRGLPGG